MTEDQIIAIADKAALYDTGLDQWVVPSSEILMAFASLVAAQAAAEEREACARACEAEHLEDPQDHADDAYDTAVFDCAAAIRGRKSP